MNDTQTGLKWIAVRSYQTAFHVANGIIIRTLAAATVPFLNFLGFGATGLVAGRPSLNPQYYCHDQMETTISVADGKVLRICANISRRLDGNYPHVPLRCRPCSGLVLNFSECSLVVEKRYHQLKIDY
jgi:hypothetical protein